jgi:uncharacterized protein
MTDLRFQWGGEELVALPELALWWPRASTLLVADAHIGKAATFRSAGVPVPRGTTTSTLSRLDQLCERLAPSRIVFLGDLLHAREGRDRETLNALSGWRACRTATDVVLVRGNHDRGAGDPPVESGIRCVDEPLLEAPFEFRHHPISGDGVFVIAGHFHPCARLRGFGRQFDRLPCFWVQQRLMVLPAFGDFTGTAPVKARHGDRVLVVAGESVLEARH